jgi:O-antigen biosynthesis protein
MHIYFITPNATDASGSLRARYISNWINTYSDEHFSMVFDHLDLREKGCEKQLSNADIVVFHRQLPNTLYIANWLRKNYPNILLVYDSDDNEFILPAQYYLNYFVTGLLDKLQATLDIVDCITVASTPLMRAYQTLGKPITLIENCFDFNLDCNNLEHIEKEYIPERFKIVFGGGTSHYQDMFDFLRLNVIQKLMRENNADLHLYGLLDFPRFERKYENGFILSAQAKRLDSYFADYFVNAATLIAPINKNKFNDCKSNLKLLEAGICCVPIIASNVECYAEYGYGVNNNLAVQIVDNNYESWNNAFMRVFENLDSAYSDALEHNKYVRENNNAMIAIDSRIRFYTEMLNYK